ncbi:MAG: glycosyltransferase, partial [Chloroflexota bacterium]
MHVTHIMKVVLVAGAERHLLTLLPALREHNITSDVLLLVEPEKPMDDYAALAAAADIPLHREIINGNLDPSLVNRIRAHIKTHQPDVVHTHLLHADVHGAAAALLSGVPVVASRHNDNAFRRRWPYRTFHWGWWRAISGGVAISDAIRNFCIDVEYAPLGKVRTVRYGVDAAPLARDVTAARAALRESLGLPDDTLIVGTMCRLIEQKGLTYGLRAFGQIQDAHPNAHL